MFAYGVFFLFQLKVKEGVVCFTDCEALGEIFDYINKCETISGVRLKLEKKRDCCSCS